LFEKNDHEKSSSQQKPQMGKEGHGKKRSNNGGKRMVCAVGKTTFINERGLRKSALLLRGAVKGLLKRNNTN